MTYTPTAWVDNSAPPISAANLLNIEKALIWLNAGVINVKDPAYGAVGNGSTNDAAAVAAALAAGAAAGADVFFPPGTYKMNSGITWDATVHSVIGLGDARFNFTGMSSGYAITVIGQAAKGTSFGFTPVRHRLSGVRIEGPDADATTVDCFKIEDTANVSNGSLEHVYVYGFRDQVWLGQNSWLNGFYKCKFSHFHRYGINADAGSNAGEMYQFFGCSFDSSTNATTNTATGYFQAVGSAADAAFFGCSFDYNDVELEVQSGTVTLDGCHLENNRTGPMIKAAFTGGSEHTTITLNGGQISPTESTTRSHYIDLTGDNIYVTINGVKWNTFNRGGAELVKVISGGPSIRFIGGDIVTGGTGSTPIPSQTINVLQNPGFETTTLAGWTTGALVTYSNQTANVHSGTRAARIVGTGGAGTSSMTQKFPVRPGEVVHLSAWLASSSMTAGSVAFSIVWKAQDGTTTVGSTGTLATISANQAYTFVGSRRIAPVQAGFAMIEFFSTNLNGTVDIDDVYAMAA